MGREGRALEVGEERRRELTKKFTGREAPTAPLCGPLPCCFAERFERDAATQLVMKGPPPRCNAAFQRASHRFGICLPHKMEWRD